MAGVNGNQSNNFPRIIYVYYRSYSFDIGTLEPLEFTTFDYPNNLPIAHCCGSSAPKSETTLQQQQAQEAQTLQNDFNQQWGEQQQYVNNFLLPQLQGMYTNPIGFGASAMADLDANLVNTTGAQAANAKQASQAQFDTANMAGLPSGVEQAIQSQIQSAAGNTVATGQNQINLANQQYKNQQQMTALQGLMQIPQLQGMSPQTGGLLTGANQAAFGEAQTIYQQNQAGDFWGNLGQGLLGGAIGAGASLLTGGLTGLLPGGGGFMAGLQNAAGMGGGQSAPVAQSWMPSYATPGQPYYPPTAPTGIPGVIGAVPT